MQEDLIKKLNLLIIEDSEYDAELMVHLLRKHDIELEYDLISSAREMKEKLSQQVYDMVISDLNLPAFSGIEALRSEEHTSELQSRGHLVCRLLLEKKNACA